MQVFSDQFWEILRRFFQRTSQVTTAVLQKYSTNEIVENSLIKEKKKMETACKKNKDTCKLKA